MDFKAYKNAWRRYEETHRVSDQVLYDMCKAYPSHDTFAHIFAKVNIIDRIYRTNLRFRRISLIDLSEYIYSKRKTVDKIFEQLMRLKTPTADNIILTSTLESIIELHGCMVSLLERFTGTEESSFVSKYMHFHRREIVPILDRRARKAIQVYSPSGDALRKPQNANSRYYDFCGHFLTLWRMTLKYESNHADIVKKLDQYLYQSGGSIEGKYRR